MSLANRLHLSGRTLLLSLMMVFFSGTVSRQLLLEDRQQSPVVDILQVAQPPDIVFFKEPVPLPDFPSGLDCQETSPAAETSDPPATAFLER